MQLRLWLSLSLLAPASGCSDDPNAWIVVELKLVNGKTAQMAFRNPAVPDITLEECRKTLKGALPTLMQGVDSVPETIGSSLVSAKCVSSVEDPLKPKK